MQGKRVLKKQKQQSNSSLLSTYFISLFSVVLCFVMLLGTTFALFYTDNTSMGNEIHSGILRVDMLHVTSVGKTSLAQHPNQSVFSECFKWTPGKSQTQTVEVINTGNVPLNYRLDFVPIEGRADNTGLAKLFVVQVQQENGARTASGKLDDVMDREKTVYLAEGEGLEPGESRLISITLQMDEIVPGGIMGRQIPLYLKLEGFQHLDSEP